MCLLLGEETGKVEWNSNGSVSLTTPSLPQCQDVISKLKENNHHWVDLSHSSSYVAQFLLPQLLKIRTITWIRILYTKVTKDNIILLQLLNNTALKDLWITDGSINDDGVITLVQSLKYNKSITHLYLIRNPDITSTSAQSLAELLLHNNTLEILYLTRTNIDTNGVLVLVETLKTNMRLRLLSLDKQHEQTCHSLPYYTTIKHRLHFM